VSESDINIDDDHDDVDDGWTKNDDLRNLEQFLVNIGLTITPNDPTIISEVVNRFLMILLKSNKIYAMLKMQANTKLLKVLSITDMKMFLAIIIFMSHVKKDKTRDYWSTIKLTETPIFGKVMSRNRYEQIWNVWHYNDNSTLDDEADIKSGQF
jgi:hypothetical protein